MGDLPEGRKDFQWVTASIAPAAVGLFSRPKAWRNHRRIGLEEWKDNPAAAFGREHEEDAVFAYECATGVVPDDTLGRQKFYIHPRYSWLGATPDGLIGDVGLLEVKCPVHMYDEVPGHYHVQMQVQLAVLGRMACDFVAWKPDETRIWRTTRSTEFFDSLVPYLYAFYRMLRDFREPPAFKPGTKPKLNYDLIATERLK